MGQTAATNGEQLTIQSDVKTRGKKGLLSVFRQGSQEPLDPDRRSQRTYKTYSFDSSPEHPAPMLDGAAAMLVKSSLIELSPEERKATRKVPGF
jgi:hypothetical protein